MNLEVDLGRIIKLYTVLFPNLEVAWVAAQSEKLCIRVCDLSLHVESWRRSCDEGMQTCRLEATFC